MPHLILTSLPRAAVLLALVGPRPFCRPVIPPGPAAARLAEQPVTIGVRAEPTGTTDIWVRAGYAIDRPGLEGAAWVTAHAVAPEQTTVDVDAEWVHFRIPCADPECASAAVRDIVATPAEERVTAARADAAAALQTFAPADAVPAMASLWLYEGHPYGHLPFGREGSLDAVTPLVAATLHRDHYVRATVTVEADSEATAAALREPLAVLPTTMAPDLPLQQPIVPEQPRALVLSTAVDPGIAAAAFALPDGELPALPAESEHLHYRVVGTQPARRQAHLRIEATAKVDVYTAQALRQAVVDLRCNPAWTDRLGAPTLVLATTDPDTLQHTLTEDWPLPSVDCIPDSMAPLAPSNLHTVPLEGALR